MNMNRSLNTEKGKAGEEVAVSFLKKKKYKILETNWRFHRDEIDIIALDKKTVVFVEVKARKSSSFGSPESAVTIHKQKRIIRAAKAFLLKNHAMGKLLARFDVISIDPDDTVRHIENAFEVE